MKALTLVATGGLEYVRVQELPEPVIQSADHVLVQVRCAALNRLDLFVIGGLPGVRHRLPHILGSDGAGVVSAVGDGVKHIHPGDRVMVNPTLSCDDCPACRSGEHSLCDRIQVIGEHVSGTAAEYIVVPAANLAVVPPGMPWPEAAAFSLATLTAWRMLTTRAGAQRDETVLIWGIGGGVALAALQVARFLGVRSIVTSGSDAKLASARQMGADATLNHSQVDVAAEVRKLTGGDGVDIILDSAGEQSWPVSLRSLRRGGRMVVCGATTGPVVALDLRRLFWHQWSLLGSTLGSRREYAEIVGLASEGKLWPVIDRVFPLDDAAAAFERLKSGAQMGKLVLEVTS